ncbi:hypothetical protein L6E12_16230 [Actinokineospora sp. PR83]|uniref:hypothetical protein n=1 Tax=Actinokineospora sp. PR83 TaxID=2884908 RepID=UPI001F43B08B|nr:hypothetical protein [Actinokineospora sp. PR83]MCG8917335.1 hypothetical protein [Actinokineospora sp. PR83]
MDSNNVTGDSGGVLQAHSVHAGTISFGGAARGPGFGSAEAPWARLAGQVHGRDGIVADLVAEVRSAQPSVIVLHAGGGYGKTTVALSVCRAVRDAFSVRWVDASTSSSLLEGLREVALAAGAEPRRVREAWDGRASAPAVLWAALSTASPSWLLVLDNTDDLSVLTGPDGLIDGRGWLRTPPPGCTLLITTRDGRPEPWPESAARHRLHQLPEPDGAAMLKGLCPTAGDDLAAGSLSRCLGNLPLALWLAGRYLRNARTIPLVPGLDVPRTFGEYEAAWRDRSVELTDQVDRSAGPRAQLSSAWEISLELLADQGHEYARPILRLLSFFSPAPIPHDVLDAQVLAAEPVFHGLTARTMATTLARLRGAGLLGSVGGGKLPTCVALHPVIRDVTRAQPDVASHHSGYGLSVARLLTRHAEHLVHAELTDNEAYASLFLLHARQSLLEQVDHSPASCAVTAALLDAIACIVENGEQGSGNAEVLRKGARRIRTLVAGSGGK